MANGDQLGIDIDIGTWTDAKHFRSVNYKDVLLFLISGLRTEEGRKPFSVGARHCRWCAAKMLTIQHENYTAISEINYGLVSKISKNETANYGSETDPAASDTACATESLVSFSKSPNEIVNSIQVRIDYQKQTTIASVKYSTSRQDVLSITRLAIDAVFQLVLRTLNHFTNGFNRLQDVLRQWLVWRLESARNSFANLTILHEVLMNQLALRRLDKNQQDSLLVDLVLQPINEQPAASTPSFANSCLGDVSKKCCSVQILAEPPTGERIRADIVFVHGLHGSLVKTWRQGQWKRAHSGSSRHAQRPKFLRAASNIPLQGDFPFADVREYQRGMLDTEDFDWEPFANNQLGDELFESISHLFLEQKGPNNDPRSGTIEEDNINETLENDEGRAAEVTSNAPNSQCWPADWLPLDCPGVRVIGVDYTTDKYLWRPLWKQKEQRSNLVERSREMADLLTTHHVGVNRPVIYVGHSKGGLFIKQIIVDAWKSGRQDLEPLWSSARGIFFYSVPHRGSNLACLRAPLLARSIEMMEIEKDAKHLLDLHNQFTKLYQLGYLKIEVSSFIETALTLMSVFYLRIVGIDSGDPGIGDVRYIRLDHREICKPRSRDCILYKELVKLINKVC